MPVICTPAFSLSVPVVFAGVRLVLVVLGVYRVIFERRSLAELGATFGISEAAARMRVERALAKVATLLRRQDDRFNGDFIVASHGVHGRPPVCQLFRSADVGAAYAIP